MDGDAIPSVLMEFPCRQNLLWTCGHIARARTKERVCEVFDTIMYLASIPQAGLVIQAREGQ